MKKIISLVLCAVVVLSLAACGSKKNDVSPANALKAEFVELAKKGDSASAIAANLASNGKLLPFAAGIDAGADAILVSHTIVECLDPETPASLSPAVHSYLRNTMGFEGVIVTDDLVMQAITDAYGAGEAAVLAVLAGNDLLCSTEYTVQYEAVLAAVRSRTGCRTGRAH